MGPHRPLTSAEKEQIYRGKLAGATLPGLADQLGCSTACVRKWWRYGRECGLTGLQAKRRGRSAAGLLSQFSPAVVAAALTYKRTHPRWGPQRVRVELQRTPTLTPLRLPSRSRLARFFKHACPEAVATYHARRLPTPPPGKPSGVHEVWQLDSQEGIRLLDQTCATICNIRDPVGAAILASCVFEVTTAKRWRKLDFPELRMVLRSAFAEWGTLPECVQTDNEVVLAGGARDGFPSALTLWLIGLGIAHRFIRPGQPRDQPEIERTHRTLDGFALDDRALQNCMCLQKALGRERQIHNTAFPSQASDCGGRPPLTAHPELLLPRRPYRPEWELSLFDLRRVYTYLAGVPLQRQVTQVGQVKLGHVCYSLGRAHAGKVVKVACLSDRAEWRFTDLQGQEVARRAIQQLTVLDLTGLDPHTQPSPLPPLQLTLPCLI